MTVAVPSMSRDLHVGPTSSAAVLSVYFLAYAVTLLPGGVLVDRVGVRLLSLLGLALFAVGAAAGALAGGLGLLIVARVIQGVGAGLVSPAALAGAMSGFPPERRGAALGLWTASAGVANLVGPLLGGGLTVAFGWRVNWWGLVLLALVSAFAISRRVPGSERGGPSTRYRTVLNGAVATCSFLAALTFAVMIGFFYLAEQYLQRSAGYSPLGASAVLVLIAAMVGVAAPVAGRLVDARGERLTAFVGFGATGLGLAVLALPSISLRSPATVVPLVPLGLGLGMLLVPASRAALNGAPQGSHGRVSALLSLGRLLGAAVGAALAGAAISGHITASAVHHALLVGCGACLVLGVPAAVKLGSPGPPLARTFGRSTAAARDRG
ncbi:MAG: MFS transporter [Solirubrobacterales bacterium]|nr:MFS transporter [Solirubrobacterales bacterium]